MKRETLEMMMAEKITNGEGKAGLLGALIRGRNRERELKTFPQTPSPASPASPGQVAPEAALRERDKGERASCGSPNCAGCYDVGDGKKIHPPKCGEDYRAWLERWEAKGRVQ